MADHMTLKIEGGEDLLKALRDLELNVSKEVKRATVAGGEVWRDASAALAPGPGIVAKVISATKDGCEVDIGPDKDHWYYQFSETGVAAHEITGTPLVFQGDEGTVVTPTVLHPGMTARPFLRPVADANQGEIVGAVGEQLRQVIEGAAA